MSKRIQKIDALTQPDHFYLDESDACFYAGEYTAGEGHAFSDTNQLILNFKKSVTKRGSPQWYYKERAIEQAAAILRAAFKSDAQVTLVPIPPSKAKADPLYDDRMSRVLELVCRDRPMLFRELLLQHQSIEAAHLANERPRPEDLIANYAIDEGEVNPSPRAVFLVDDVLTTGSHFKAAKHVLLQRFPALHVAGLFLARRVPKSVIPDDFDLNI